MSCTEHIAVWKVILVVEQTAAREEVGREEEEREEKERAKTERAEATAKGEKEMSAKEKQGRTKSLESAVRNMSNCFLDYICTQEGKEVAGYCNTPSLFISMDFILFN